MTGLRISRFAEADKGKGTTAIVDSAEGNKGRSLRIIVL